MGSDFARKVEDIMIQEEVLNEVIAKDYGNIGGIYVKRKDDILYENYFNSCTKESTFHIFSVTKSIVGILVGIAMDKGLIKSVDEKLATFFPDILSKEVKNVLSKVTLRDMLTMRVPFQEMDFGTFFEKEDWAYAAMEVMHVNQNANTFYYAPLIGPDILSKIVQQVSGASLLAFANEYLFHPLEIIVGDSICFQNKEEQLAWYQRINPKGWVSDKKGTNTAGWGLNLSTKDLGKIGELCLQHGRLHNKQLISDSWMKEMTSRQNYCEEWKLAYGYLWWVLDEKEHVYAAMGDGGNILYVNEAKDLVVVITSFLDTNAKDRISFIRSYIEPLLS